MTIQPSTIADRVDHALDLVLAGQPAASAAATAGLASRDRALAAIAARLRSSLPPPPIGARFEARLGARLADIAHRPTGLGWARRHQGRLIVTGAVGSAVGVGVTAYAVWRTTRRAQRSAHRLLAR